jgi:hypothetical protein
MSPVQRTINAGNAPQEHDDKIGAAAAKRFEFSAQGQVQVKVKVKRGKNARVKAVPANDPPSQDDFTLLRLVMNLEVPGGADEIELEVKALEGETKLAYYYNNKWNIIPHTKAGGFFKASVKNWPDDPSVGMGR